jgi:hypothetical protein
LSTPCGANGEAHLREQLGGVQAGVGVAHEGGRGQLVRVGQDHRAARLHGVQRVHAGAHHQVAGQQHVGLLGVDAHLVEQVGRRRDAHEGQHRTALLREAHEVEHRGALALQVRGHADEGADRHHTGAAHAGHQQVEGPRPGPGRGLADGAQLARHLKRR